VTPRYERFMFRIALVGLVVVLGFFGYRTVIDPTEAAPVRQTSSTETTVPSETTTSVPGDTTTTVPGETTTTTAPVVLQSFAIMSPRDQTHVASGSILLAGVGAPGSVVARAETATNVDARGVWSLRLGLLPGANLLALTETAPDGTERQAALTVHFDA
jgi:hypothetical protein